MATSHGLIIEVSKNEKLQKNRIILSQHTSYLHKWLVHFLIYLLLLCTFFSGKFRNECNLRTTLNPLWKPEPPGLEFFGSGLAYLPSSRLALFHVIRNFLANEIFFSRLSHQTDCLLLGQHAPYNQLLIQQL